MTGGLQPLRRTGPGIGPAGDGTRVDQLVGNETRAPGQQHPRTERRIGRGVPPDAARPEPRREQRTGQRDEHRTDQVEEVGVLADVDGQRHRDGQRADRRRQDPAVPARRHVLDRDRGRIALAKLWSVSLSTSTAKAAVPSGTARNRSKTWSGFWPTWVSATTRAAGRRSGSRRTRG